MSQYKGACLCGSCRYIITGERPEAMYLCHCSRCRKETGTSYGANAFFNNAQLLWEKGQENMTFFKLEGTRKQRAFCNICGSPLPRLEDDSTVVLPVGTLDDDSFLDPTAHIHYASRSSWEDKVTQVRQFDELPKSG